MTDELEILHDVVVFDVAVDQSTLLVDLYGSTANVCGNVRFLLPDQERRESARGLLEQWCRQSTPLTLIARGSAVALQNDHAIFGAQLEPPVI